MSEIGCHFQGFDGLPEELKGCVLTIGNFDGVHVGHRRILDCCRQHADQEGLRMVVLTFDPPPDLVLRAEDEPQRIDPAEPNALRLCQAGADHVVVAQTDESLVAMSPEEFLDQVVHRYFAPRHVVEGKNFYFGIGRSGNVQTLRDAGARRGFVVHVVEPVVRTVRGKKSRISSTLIRLLIQTGRVEEARDLLARPYALYGRVVSGCGQGRVLQFPTANLDPGEQVVPIDGVYAGTSLMAGREVPTAISIGTKPTLGPGERTIEAHLIDETGELDLYEQQLEVRFEKRLRDQVRFESVEALREAIDRDVQAVRQLHARS